MDVSPRIVSTLPRNARYEPTASPVTIVRTAEGTRRCGDAADVPTEEEGALKHSFLADTAKDFLGAMRQADHLLTQQAARIAQLEERAVRREAMLSARLEAAEAALWVLRSELAHVDNMPQSARPGVDGTPQSARPGACVAPPSCTPAQPLNVPAAPPPRPRPPGGDGTEDRAFARSVVEATRQDPTGASLEILMREAFECEVRPPLALPLSHTSKPSHTRRCSPHAITSQRHVPRCFLFDSAGTSRGVCVFATDHPGVLLSRGRDTTRGAPEVPATAGSTCG